MTALKNKVCFVTGGGSGIGRATCATLIKEGSKVFTLELSPDNVESLKNEFSSESFGVMQGSVSDEKKVEEAFAECRKKFGPVDVLLNNAGLGIPTPDLAETDLADYQKMIDVNMTGVFLATREALKEMKVRRSGHIITLISMAGQRSNPGAPIYCASKFGARGLNSGLADQVLRYGIKVTDINPGPTDSNYWGNRQVPREKFLSVNDVADVIKYVLSVPEHMIVREINFDSIHWLAK